jgi:hypothetical protein
VFVSGADRSTATIEETIPQGWRVTNISHGGVESNGVIRWSLTNLPIGETVLTYKVTAPAAPADFAEWAGVVRESVNIIRPTVLPFLNITGGERVTDGLVVLYTFNEGRGNKVHDVSGVGTPLDLTIEDQTRVRWGDNFLETTGVNHIETDGPATKIIQTSMSTNELTVEGWIKTSDITQNGPARIITCSLDASDRNFTLGQGQYGQGGDRLEMRYRTDINPSNPNAVIAVNTDRGTLTEALTHVVFTRNSDWEVFGYVNNVPLDLTGGVISVDGDFSTWDDTYKFGIGNEVSAARAWLGQFHLVAVYSRALSAKEVSQNYNAGPFLGQDTIIVDWSLR